MQAFTLLLFFLTAPVAAYADASTQFDPRPAHPWNQLYGALFGAAPADNNVMLRAPARRDESDARLAGEDYRRLLAALDAFLTKHAENLLTAPVKRALLQSALWATFDEVSDPRGQRRRLQPDGRRLVRRRPELLEVKVPLHGPKPAPGG